MNALHQRYDPEGREGWYSMELMKRGGVVRMWLHLVMGFASWLAKHTLDRLPEAVLVDLYICGLGDKSLDRHVYLEKPQSLAEAIKLAISFDGFDETSTLSQGSERVRKPRPSDVAAVSSGPKCEAEATATHVSENSPSALQALGATLQAMVNSLTNLGEKMSTIDEKLGSSTAPSESVAAVSRDFPNIKCLNCEEMGHYANACPKPKRQKNNKQSAGQKSNSKGSGTSSGSLN